MPLPNTYLNSELASWTQDDCLNASCAEHIVFAQVLCDRKTECKRLATTCEVTRNHILSIEDRIETMLLDREQVFNTTGD